tara:strand:- start:674 stop:1072 length:399 start_codon:yes stop_codon:yes gene_type:complete
MGNLIWKSKSTKVDQPWGEQILWSAPWGLRGKVTYIDAGNRTSKKMYKQKREIIYLLSGKVQVIAYGKAEFYDNVREDGAKCYNLDPGDTVLIEPSSIYRICAEEDSVLVEIQHGQDSGGGLVRIEDDYGRT